MGVSELQRLLRRLVSFVHETEWVEFKHSYADPEDIGEYLSALSNSAALHGKESAYLVWGVRDITHEIVGTKFKPRQAKKGNEELENWLLRLLSPRIDLRIHEFLEDSHEIVIFEIQPANRTPVRFSGTEYIRVGSLKKKLAEYPEKERALWAVFSASPFENGWAVKDIPSDDVLRLIDYPTCFELLDQPLPDNRSAILERLTQEKVITDHGQGRFGITNLGGVMFAMISASSIGFPERRCESSSTRTRAESIRCVNKYRPRAMRSDSGMRSHSSTISCRRPRKSRRRFAEWFQSIRRSQFERSWPMH